MDETLEPCMIMLPSGAILAPGGCAADCQNSLQYLLGGKTFFLYCKDKNVAVNFSGWLRGLLLRLLAGV